jgi:hypothetical protein
MGLLLMGEGGAGWHAYAWVHMVMLGMSVATASLWDVCANSDAGAGWTLQSGVSASYVAGFSKQG